MCSRTNFKCTKSFINNACILCHAINGNSSLVRLQQNCWFLLLSNRSSVTSKVEIFTAFFIQVKINGRFIQNVKYWSILYNGYTIFSTPVDIFYKIYSTKNSVLFGLRKWIQIILNAILILCLFVVVLWIKGRSIGQK